MGECGAYCCSIYCFFIESLSPLLIKKFFVKLGQAIQEGPQNIFESVLKIKKPKHDLKMLKEKMNFDGLNYMADKTVNYVNEQARKGTVDAYFVGNVPIIQVEIEKIDERNLAYLMYFYMITCVILK